MIPEIGHVALLIAFSLCFLEAVVPFIGTFTRHASWMSLSRTLIILMAMFMVIAFISLGYAFYNNDFSLPYVALHSNSFLPWYYRLSAIWGGHEGSLLLWAFFLSLWMLGVSYYSRPLPLKFKVRLISILAMVLFGFLLFLISTSNPFIRTLPEYPLEGRDLNPLLQDIGLIIHPPLLYMGYVGFTVPFAFSLACLLTGEIQTLWLRWIRLWTLGAWACLTLGVTVGSFWAYYELGWGGYWFWDPVENASLMPWLLGTALIHVLIAAEKKGLFLRWTILLSILVFSFSLVGTFLVRSGIISSVHAFASDPDRGIFILAFLMIIIGSALFLYGIRVSRFPQKEQTLFLISRETFLLSQTLVLTVATFTVLLGTLYPLIMDALYGLQLSVGYPYFNTVFIPLMIPFFVLMGGGLQVPWGKQTFLEWISALWKPFLTVVFILGLIWIGFIWKKIDFSWILVGGLFLGIWIIYSVILLWIRKIKLRGSLSFGALSTGFAHAGIGMLIIGIAVTEYFSVEREVRASPGASIVIHDYTIDFKSIALIEGPNYISHKGYFEIKQGVTELGKLYPEKRVYVVNEMPVSETAILPGLFRDFYIALGEPLGRNEWSIRLYYKPFVRWIWLGGFFMALGALMGIIHLYGKKETK